MKPIYLSDAQKEECRKEFERQLKRGLIKNDRFSVEMVYKFTKAEAEQMEKAILVISPLAFAKIVSVVGGFNTEVAWYGLTSRIAPDKPHFLLRDIVVYPQTVTGSTVVMENEDEFWKSMSEEDALNMRFHGHSHVNMACTPSTTDMDHRQAELRLLPRDSYQIFMIWNKRLEFTTAIYDCANNVQYENADVEVVIGTEDLTWNSSDYCEELKKVVVEKKSAVLNTGYTAAQALEKADDKKKKKKAEKPDPMDRMAYRNGVRWNPYTAAYEYDFDDNDEGYSANSYYYR